MAVGEQKRSILGRAFNFIGIKRERGRGLIVGRRFLLLVLCAGVGLVLASAGFVVYSGTSHFCTNCHIMAPYVKSWEESSHNNVACVKCHIPPGVGNYVHAKFVATKQLIETIAGTNVQSFTAEIADASCLRSGCHDTRLLPGSLLYKGKYKFDHAKHLGELRRGKQLRCTSCHSQLVQGEHMTVTESVCFTCHFEGHVHERFADPIAGCTSCHDVPQGELAVAEGVTFDHKPYQDRGVDCWKCHFDTVQGTGHVSRQACIVCHKEPERLARFDDSKFIHDWHVTRRKVECFQCHQEIKHGAKAASPMQMSGGDCASCHTGSHSPQSMIYAGRGGRGVPDMPSAMHLTSVNCIGCHEIQSGGHGPHQDMKTFATTAQSCVDCHGGSYRRMFGQWKEMIADSLEEARGALAAAKAAAEKVAADDPRRGQIDELLSLAQHNCDFVEQARGAHNVEYATALLEKAAESAGEAQRLAEQEEAAAEQVEATTEQEVNG